MHRKCPFKGCRKAIDFSRFACPEHWFRLNRDQRQRIYSGYDCYMSGNINVEELQKIQAEVLKEVDP